jgi:hypothetical protein
VSSTAGTKIRHGGVALLMDEMGWDGYIGVGQSSWGSTRFCLPRLTAALCLVGVVACPTLTDDAGWFARCQRPWYIPCAHYGRLA